MTAPDAPGRHAIPYRLQQSAASYPVEPKVKASAGAGTLAAGLITPALVQIIDDLFLDGPGPDTVPAVYVGLLGAVVVAVCSWVAGWAAPHVDRLREGDG